MDERSSEARTRRHAALDLVVVALFAAGIATPLVRATLSGTGGEGVRAELREPAPAPELPIGGDLAAWEALPGRIEAWWNDAMPGRRALLRWSNALRLFVLRTAPLERLALGRDGWLYLVADHARESSRNHPPFGEGELARWCDALAARRDWCAARGARYVLAVAPDKHTVYPEHLPPSLRPLRARSRVDELALALAARGEAGIVDLRPALAAARERDLAYYPHGTHWNEIGAHAAYARILEALPGIEPWPREDFARVSRPPGDTWADRLHLEGWLEQESPGLDPLRPRRALVLEHWISPNGTVDGVLVHPDASLPRAVLLRDSFGDWLWPFLGEHFSRLRLENTPWFPIEVLEEERPDVVLHELVERHLWLRAPGLPGTPEGRAREARFLAGRTVLSEEGAPDPDRRRPRLPLGRATPRAPLALSDAVPPAARTGGVLRLELAAEEATGIALRAGSSDLDRRRLDAGARFLFFDVPEGLDGVRLALEAERPVELLSLELRAPDG